MKRFFAQCYIWILLIVLYTPIVFIAIFSFTESRVLGNWTGFSTKLYTNLFTGDMQGTGSLMAAIQNTLIIALIAAVGPPDCPTTALPISLLAIMISP